MQQNPFNQNPLTRNRVLPTVTFAKPDEAKNLTVPPAEPYDPSKLPQNNLTVPNQLPDPTAGFGGTTEMEVEKGPLSKDEWTKWRFKKYNGSHGSWGDAWGREEVAKEQQQDKISQEFARQSAIGNAKLSADLEKDEFRKELLKDIDSGKYFPKTHLEEVNESFKRSNISTTTIKENENGSNPKQQDIH